MKTKISLLIALLGMFVFASCKKDSISPQLAFANSLAEGNANASGEYTITGRINSTVRLDKVTLTIEGQTTPFFVDESTAKNKNEYDFSYLVTGISENTYIIIDVYDQNGGKVSHRFLIKK